MMSKKGRAEGTELAVLRLIAEGRTDRKIAAEVGLGVGSVHTYCRRLCEKTGCTNRAQLARYAVARGLVPVEWDPPGAPTADRIVTKL